MQVTNIISFDIEEIFHGEYTRHLKKLDSEYRTDKNIVKVLDLLDEYNVKATFFVVGELADKFPDLLEKISKRGHEIGFHTHDHIPLWKKTPTGLDHEISSFRKVVEKIGKQLHSFRAPSFSIDQSDSWALDVLEKNGIVRDSSIFPARTILYGVKDAPNHPYFPSPDNLAKSVEVGKILEYPVLTWKWGRFILPTGGGFYLRSLPIWVIKKAIRSMNNSGYPAVIYIHNWELDDNNPSLDIGLKEKFIVYNGIRTTEKKLRNLLSLFSFTSFEDIHIKHGL